MSDAWKNKRVVFVRGLDYNHSSANNFNAIRRRADALAQTIGCGNAVRMAIAIFSSPRSNCAPLATSLLASVHQEHLQNGRFVPSVCCDLNVSLGANPGTALPNERRNEAMRLIVKSKADLIILVTNPASFAELASQFLTEALFQPHDPDSLIRMLQRYQAALIDCETGETSGLVEIKY